MPLSVPLSMPSYAPLSVPAPPPPKFFRLIDAEDDTSGYLPNVVFETGREAADYAQKQRAKGRKLRVVREVSPEDVLEGERREETRFMSGEYDRLPPWFPTRNGHYVHWAKDEAKRREGFIAYSPSPLHLAEDRQVMVLASRYLAKEHPRHRPEEIATLHQRLLATFAPVEFKVTRDPAIGRLAYIGHEHCAEASDFPSCMRHPPDSYGLPPDRHPCDAYLGPDSTLSLAYTHRAGVPEDIRARAIVSERHKFFVRVYGFDEMARRALLDALEDAGYSRSDSFEGERLHLDPHPTRRKCVVVPYLDGDVQFCDEDGTISPHGGVDCEQTSGYSRVDSGGVCCENCGERVHRDDGTMVDGDFWCDTCADEHSVYCEHYGERVSGHGADEVVVQRGRTQAWCAAAVDDHAFYCERAERYYANNYYTSIEVRTERGTETWCREATTSDWREDDDGDFWSVEDFPEADEDDSEDDKAEAA